MTLHPTSSRLALLRNVAARRVFRDVAHDDYISAERKVNARIAEMERAGWVALDAGKDADGTSTWSKPRDSGHPAEGPKTAWLWPHGAGGQV